MLRDLLQQVNDEIDEAMKSHGGAAVVELKPEEMEEAKKAVEEI